MEFTGLTSASHTSLPEAGYGSEEGQLGSEISGAVSGVTTPGASRLQASQLQERSTTMQRLHRTIAARTRDLILDTILAVTNSYSTVLVLLWNCTGQPNPQIGLKWRCDTPPPPSGDGPEYPLPCLGVMEPPRGFALRRGVKR